MKRTVRVVMIGALLQGSAYADEQSATDKLSPENGQGKVAIARHQSPAGKTKPAPDKKVNAKGKIDPLAQEKQRAVMETPSDSTGQSVQLKGIRG